MQLCKRLCIFFILLLFPTIVDARIVFLAAPNRADNNSIYVMDDDGSNRTLIYDTMPSIFKVRWSPDGQIVFESNGTLYLINPDGTKVRQLYKAKAVIQSFAFSPDGKQIVLSVEERVDHRAVWSIQMLDVRTRKIKKISDLDTSELDWSPDGKYILSTSAILLGGEKLGNSIYIMDASGKNVKGINGQSQAFMLGSKNLTFKVLCGIFIGLTQ